ARCLSKEPDERPASARKLLNALDMFSTASGEIRTMEHKVPRVERMTPTAVLATKTPTEEVPGTIEPIAVSATPAREQPPYVDEPAEAAQPEFGEVGYVPPKKDRTKLVVGGLVILVPVAVGAFLLS